MQHCALVIYTDGACKGNETAHAKEESASSLDVITRLTSLIQVGRNRSVGVAQRSNGNLVFHSAGFCSSSFCFSLTSRFSFFLGFLLLTRFHWVAGCIAVAGTCRDCLGGVEPTADLHKFLRCSCRAEIECVDEGQARRSPRSYDGPLGTVHLRRRPARGTFV